MTYTFFSSLKAVWLGLFKKYDVVLVHETSPVMVGIPAIIVKKIKRIKSHFWVLDLWPESLTAAGGITNKYILGFFRSLSRWIYRNSDSILIGSKGFAESISKIGDFKSKCIYFPNWVDNVAKVSPMRIFEYPEGFNVVFTGNIGEAQDVEHILDAAERVRGTGINIILVGDGRKRKYAVEYVKTHGISNVFLPGSFPREAMSSIYDKADLLLLSLKRSHIFALTVPAKLQVYMDSGKPIVAMIDGESANLIKESDCGWSVPAEDSKALATLLLALSNESNIILSQKGKNGKKYSQEHFQFQKCIDNLEQLISS